MELPVNNFNRWMDMIQNQHQQNNERMQKAFEIVQEEWAEHYAKSIEVKEPQTLTKEALFNMTKPIY